MNLSAQLPEQRMGTAIRKASRPAKAYVAGLCAELEKTRTALTAQQCAYAALTLEFFAIREQIRSDDARARLAIAEWQKTRHRERTRIQDLEYALRDKEYKCRELENDLRRKGHLYFQEGAAEARAFEQVKAENVHLKEQLRNAVAGIPPSEANSRKKLEQAQQKCETLYGECATRDGQISTLMAEVAALKARLAVRVPSASD